MRRKYLSLLLLPLAACATPQEQCVAAATQDLRVLDALILETRTNIERGFGVEEVIVPNSGFTWCYGNWGYNTGINFCSAPSTRTVERPVTIDLEVERLRDGAGPVPELSPLSENLARHCHDAALLDWHSEGRGNAPATAEQ